MRECGGVWERALLGGDTEISAVRLFVRKTTLSSVFEHVPDFCSWVVPYSEAPIVLRVPICEFLHVLAGG